jgi:hypothetical protein
VRQTSDDLTGFGCREGHLAAALPRSTGAVGGRSGHIPSSCLLDAVTKCKKTSGPRCSQLPGMSVGVMMKRSRRYFQSLTSPKVSTKLKQIRRAKVHITIYTSCAYVTFSCWQSDVVSDKPRESDRAPVRPGLVLHCPPTNPHLVHNDAAPVSPLDEVLWTMISRVTGIPSVRRFSFAPSALAITLDFRS